MKQLELIFWGILAAMGALFVELIALFLLATYQNPTGTDSFEIFTASLPIIFFFVLIEEFFKFSIIARKVEPMSLNNDFIWNSFLVGLGFALTEIIMIYLQDPDLKTPFLSIFRIALIHISTAGIMGYLLALKNLHKISTIFVCIFNATFWHLIYNVLTFKTDQLNYSNQAIATVLILLVIINISNLFRLPQKLAS